MRENGVITYLPATSGPSRKAIGDGVGDGDAVGDGKATPGPPVPPVPGRKLMPATATATTAAAAKASFGAVFIRWTLRAGHQDRRCGVAGTWSSTVSRTRSGSA